MSDDQPMSDWLARRSYASNGGVLWAILVILGHVIGGAEGVILQGVAVPILVWTLVAVWKRPPADTRPR